MYEFQEKYYNNYCYSYRSFPLKNINRDTEIAVLMRINAILAQHYKVLNYVALLASLCSKIFSIEYLLLSVSLVLNLLNINVVETKAEALIQVVFVIVNLSLSFLLNFHAELLGIQV